MQLCSSVVHGERGWVAVAPAPGKCLGKETSGSAPCLGKQSELLPASGLALLQLSGSFRMKHAQAEAGAWLLLSVCAWLLATL